MNDLKTVKEILQKHINTENNLVYIFGSRALGNHRENSDLDVLIDDQSILPETVSLLIEEFEQSNLLYKVDIVLRSRISDEFYHKIKNNLKSI